MEEKKETVVVTNSGGAGWLVAVVLLVVLAGVGYYMYTGQLVTDDGDVDIKVEIPKAE